MAIGGLFRGCRELTTVAFRYSKTDIALEKLHNGREGGKEGKKKGRGKERRKGRKEGGREGGERCERWLAFDLL